MPLGFDREPRVVNLTDTAEVYATLFDKDGDPLTENDIASVEFTIQRPGGTEVTLDGEVLDDGSGYLAYPDTDLSGQYKAVAQFTLDGGVMRSVRCDFQVIDPFEPPAPTDIELVAEATWDRFEDCFDSDLGGPWLRDQTMDRFDPKKIPMFISDALFDINQMNPPTNAVMADFLITTDGGQTRPEMPLLVEGTLVAVIRHLMRSYVEQPQPQGAQIVYEDRRDYLQRWGTILQVEKELYFHWAALWKRRFLQLGHSKLLVSSKAGRLLPAPLRSRNIGRGYY